MKSNQIIMQDARGRLKDNWPMAIITYLVTGFLPGAVGPLGLIVAGPLEFGVSTFSLNLSRKKHAEFTQVLYGFSRRLVDSVLAYLLRMLFVMLWSLLFVIPGIVALIAYSQTFFILNEDKKISGLDAISKSKLMMVGHKVEFLCLCLRFTGWFILSLMTCGIGFLWLVPYARVSFAGFYNELKKAQ